MELILDSRFDSLSFTELNEINGGVNGWQVAAITVGAVAFAFAPVIGAAVFAGGGLASAGLGAAFGAAAGGATIIDEALKW
ncbi:hypothetical protein CLHOM_25750 [Clostridium homopropionicum DSM 5847]|uniref:Class IIb bacteriocin, lactobin A/cerein 7B family n=1 Tax=Clostridium homopropionicum DSM 5847 TaxID=1121318 RepID=A0A0L6Z7X6_9CLOT|nr:hypothetical protein [Clostridium homopropionicum]KOA19072.1 hypothetical protein CLHOM_25750 [Clostridium homopropionicum DSM 5847]SFG97307.1 hypothetical protein SAMN04488501_12912 [Clostridium homopropionicum]